MAEKLKVLFLCTGNSCRSQMAEGWVRYLHGDRIEPFSAGVDPGTLDPLAVAVMAEVGIDISGQSSKPLAEVIGIPLDVVVTVCDHARETCPVFPGPTRVAHHGFDDPPHLAAASSDDDEVLSHYRRVRDEIRTFVEDLPESLGSSVIASAT